MTDHRWVSWPASTVALASWPSKNLPMEFSNMINNMKKFKDMSPILLKSCNNYWGEGIREGSR